MTLSWQRMDGGGEGNPSPPPAGELMGEQR
jgi:hypothetical protein